MTAVQLQQLKDAFNADYDQQAVTMALDMAFGSTEQDTQPSMVTIDYATDQVYGFPTEAKAANITHIKHIRFYDNQNIYVFDITLDATCNIARARVNIKKLVTRLMIPYSNAILLFHYADATNKEWRISWVTKGSGNTHTGAAKRYTFLCGKMHPARTIVDRLSKISESKLSSLPDKITEAFSVEALSDEFFAEYKAFYEDIVQYICGARYVEVKQNKYERKEIEDAQTIAKRGIFAKFVEQAIKEKTELSKPISETDPKKRETAEKQQEEAKVEAAEKLVRNYVKKLLGRLVFIQFLAKKGWMGLKPTDAWGAGNEHFLHNIYDDYQKNSGNGNFVGDVLNKVLFYSLNNTTGMDGNVAICSNNIAGTNYKFPYLNGGLFEETELDKLDITILGDFFVSDNREYADDDAKAPKNTTRKFIETAKKKSKKKNGEESANVEEYPYSASEGLFEFFERYNFTIDENGSDEAVVGIDPEMLGKIFENLLEDNKDKGAFYTPKPVVEYMCQQSLIAYLQNGVLNGVQNGSLQNSMQNGVLNGVQNEALQNGLQNGVQNLSVVSTSLQNGVQTSEQTTPQNANETPTTNTPSDELQKANLAFIRDSLTEGEIKAQIEHFVKTKSLEIENSVESRQGLGEVGIESGIEKESKSDKKATKKLDALVEILNQLLKDVKICDPAIGSGAFPMGLLNELLGCRLALAEWLIDNSKGNAVFDDWGAKPTDGQREHLRARLKKEIIQNNIYGVDIEEGAIEIARLRFWLSIVIELDKPEPLPNFDYKFMQGNSLLESYEGIDLSNLSAMKKKRKKEVSCDLFGKVEGVEKDTIYLSDAMFGFDLQKAIKDYFAINDHSQKQEQKAEIDEYLKCVICHTLSVKAVELNGTISNLKAVNSLKPKQQKVLEETEAEYNRLQDIIKNFHSAICDKFFLWHLWFKDVFDNGGFDIFIGNPPYFQMPKGVVDAKKYPYSEGKDPGKQNIYKLFIELAYNLLREMGVNSFITQSSLMCDASAQYTRELLLKNTTLYQVIEFPQEAPHKEGQLFKSASVATCIYLYAKMKPNDGHKFNLSDNNDLTTLYHFDFAEMLQTEPLLFYPKCYCFPLIRKRQFDIIVKMNKGTRQLDKLIDSSAQGDLNLTNEKRYFGETVTSVKLYRGCHVHRYYIDAAVTEYIQSGYKQNIVQSNISTSYLISQQVQNLQKEHRVNMVISNNVSCLFGNSVNKLLPKPQYNIKMLLGILNSKPIDWYFRRTSTNNHINIYELEQLPIPTVSSAQQQEIITIVDKILTIKNADPTTDTTNYERQIDALVYELYGITSYEELLEIEGNPSSALQMLILIHIHQQPNFPQTSPQSSIQTSIQSAYPTIPPSDIQTAISALVNEKVILQNPTLSWA